MNSSHHSPSMPDTPPMPWPFTYPPLLPPRPWTALEDGERIDWPLIRGWVGQGLAQVGYTLSKGVQIGGKTSKYFAVKFHGRGGFVKLGGLELGVEWGKDGLRLWETFSLPMFPSRIPSGFKGKVVPTVGIDLKIQGPLGWNTTYTVRYEDVYTSDMPETGEVHGSSGVFVAIAPVRVAAVAAVAYVVAYTAYVASAHLSLLGGSLWKVMPAGQ